MAANVEARRYEGIGKEVEETIQTVISKICQKKSLRSVLICEVAVMNIIIQEASILGQKAYICLQKI